jgi:hypothetical protein
MTIQWIGRMDPQKRAAGGGSRSLNFYRGVDFHLILTLIA